MDGGSPVEMLAKGTTDVVQGNRIGAAIREAHAESQDAQIVPESIVRIVRVGAEMKWGQNEFFLTTNFATLEI